METSNVQPMIEPDPQQMRRHVAHLFEGLIDGCHEGKIELAWTDGRDGKLKHAAIFGTDQLDELVARAITENRKPGQNVYVGQALRKPNIAPFGRCNDNDFFALTALLCRYRRRRHRNRLDQLPQPRLPAHRRGHHRPPSASARADALAA